MVNLRQQRRLAASILRVGKGRVWMDPNEVNEIALANSRKAVRKLIKDNFIFKKKIAIHSRQRALLRKQERRLGRHTGLGKRRGCSDGRMPQKILWIRRQRTLRRLLKKSRCSVPMASGPLVRSGTSPPRIIPAISRSCITTNCVIV